MRYIVRSCKKCVNYAPNNDDVDPCVRCRRYADDYFKEKIKLVEWKEIVE